MGIGERAGCQKQVHKESDSRVYAGGRYWRYCTKERLRTVGNTVGNISKILTEHWKYRVLLWVVLLGLVLFHDLC